MNYFRTYTQWTGPTGGVNQIKLKIRKKPLQFIQDIQMNYYF